MNHWQDFLVLGLIGAAAIYLAGLFWFRLSKRGGIGCLSCRNCSSYRGNEDLQHGSGLVDIQLTPRDADRKECEG